MTPTICGYYNDGPSTPIKVDEKESNVGGKPKLLPDVVRQIRAMDGLASYDEIAKKFNMSPQSISSIIRRVTWKDVV